MAESTHAQLPPSGFKALMLCPGKPRMERGMPDTANEYSAGGSVAHIVSSWCLADGAPAASAYIGRIVESDGFEIKVTEDFARDVQVYVDAVFDRRIAYLQAGAVSVQLEVEQQVPIGHITGEEGATGTADVVMLVEFKNRALIEVCDLKFGKGVEVEVQDNPQIMLYAAGALEKFGLVYDFTEVRMMIHQPRIRREPIEHTISVDELQYWVENTAKPAASHAWNVLNSEKEGAVIHHLSPHTEACRFCKASGTCAALAQVSLDTVKDTFEDLDAVKGMTALELVADPFWVDIDEDIGEQLDGVIEGASTLKDSQLDRIFPVLELIEDWIKAIRARIESRLFDGVKFDSAKLVQGRRGSRAWSSEAEIEALFKSFRLKQEEMYSFKVISPTQAEKMLADQPKRWKKVETLITQADGKPSVAPITDKRPALVIAPAVESFDDLTGDDLA